MASTTHLGVNIFRLRTDSNGAMTDPATGTRYSAYARPATSITPASNDLLKMLVEDSPAASIEQIRAQVNFDPDLTAALDLYIRDGHGAVTASAVFRCS